MRAPAPTRRSACRRGPAATATITSPAPRPRRGRRRPAPRASRRGRRFLPLAPSCPWRSAAGRRLRLRRAERSECGWVRTLRRTLLCTGIVIVAAAWGAGSAAAHAKLVGSAPVAGASGVQRDAASVVLRFSEQVGVLDGSDVTVMDGRGRRVDAGTARTSSGDPRRVIVPLRGPLSDDSFSVRFRIVSDDSHLAEGAFAFAVGRASLRDPLPVGAVGLSDTGAVAVAVRWAELIVFGLLLGLIVFRALVWDVVASAAYRSNADERDRALRDGRSLFWRTFWGLAALAGVAEAAVLLEKSAVAFHTGLIGAMSRPDILTRVVSESRF